MATDSAELSRRWRETCSPLFPYGDSEIAAIAFRLEPTSGVATYLQLVQQAKHAIRYGMLRPGDQLPTAREVVERLAINPNTVLKAYRELERDGLVASRPGLGTFVTKDARRPLTQPVHLRLRRTLDRWVRAATAAGLDRESMVGMLDLALYESEKEEDDERGA